MIKDKIKMAYDKFWVWCKDSGSIVIARMEVLGGLLIGAVSAFDWGPLVALGSDAAFSLKQGIYLGGLMFVKGIMSEWVRRRGDPYMTVQSAVATQEVNKVEVAKAKKQVKKTLDKVPNVVA